jgi:hypothetical protein
MKKREKQIEEYKEKTFIAYIIKGNRQIIKREIIASKKFVVDGLTYIVNSDCIFLKNIDGIIKSVCYYRENNPNPYKFKTDNKGISSIDFDNFYSEDFHNIIVKLKPQDKSIYILMVVIVTLVLSVILTIQGVWQYYL